MEKEEATTTQGNRSPVEKTSLGHMYNNDKDNGNETETIKPVMATIGSTGIEHQNGYESIRKGR